jgi:hypothetical protein
LTIHSVEHILLIGSVTLLLCFSYVSFFEWVLHKYLMHTPLLGYSFHAHALVHHGLFRADRSYHLQRAEDEPKVTFAWWNAPGLLFLHLPLLIVLGSLGGRAAYWGGAGGLVSYYALYEYLHWCMHVPHGRWFETTRVFRFLKAHHYLHHRFAFRNLNVVLPLADWLLGTLVLPSAQDLTAPELVSSDVTPPLTVAAVEPQA